MHSARPADAYNRTLPSLLTEQPSAVALATEADAHTGHVARSAAERRLLAARVPLGARDIPRTGFVPDTLGSGRKSATLAYTRVVRNALPHVYPSRLGKDGCMANSDSRYLLRLPETRIRWVEATAAMEREVVLAVVDGSHWLQA